MTAATIWALFFVASLSTATGRFHSNYYVEDANNYHEPIYDSDLEEPSYRTNHYYEMTTNYGARIKDTYSDVCKTSLNEAGHCQPISLCTSEYWKPPLDQYCPLRSGAPGVCCPVNRNESIGPSYRSFLNIPFTLEDIENGAQKGYEILKAFKELEDKLFEDGLDVKEGTPSFGHFLHTSAGPECLDQSLMGLEVVHTTKAIREKYNLKKDDINYGLQHTDLGKTSIADACLTNPGCKEGNYRTIDGSCNNVHNSRWGMVNAPLQRIISPAYSDDIWAYRMSSTGEELPSPRLISTTLYPDNDNPDPLHTLMVMQFGQFIAHDLTHTPAMTYANGAGINCCRPDGTKLDENEKHFACMEIDVPDDDPFFNHFGQKCINFVRSMLAPRYSCNLGYAEQMNKVTHYLDGSSIYGSTDSTASALRTFKDGQLKVLNDFGRDLPPLSDPDKKVCITQEKGAACFAAGDDRANQKVTLVALHTVFLREHNRIAHQLCTLNPHWSDETIYQEARRLVVAELQHITYKEYLPELLGARIMSDYELSTDELYSDNYDPLMNPSITNAFAAAAFRYGHSTVDTRLWVYEEDKVDEVIYLPEVMFSPGRMRNREFYDRILITLTTQPMQSFDPFVSEALTRYMFRAGFPYGLDLISINIQRGRDHGMPSYNYYREICGLKKANQFGDMKDTISPVVLKRLEHLYDDVDDVDLYVGGLSEKSTHDSIVGPTFNCIIADQFARLKRGDRFFYDNVNQPHPFTKAQLHELKKVTLARIICDNSDKIELTEMTPNVFITKQKFYNDPIPCDSHRIPRMDLEAWKEY